MKHYDVMIIGSGAAGLSVALALPSELNIVLISKSSIDESATFYAQGGISAVMDHADTTEAHITDTLIAGAGLCDVGAVTNIVSNGRDRIEWLIEQGVPFSTRTSKSGVEEFHLTQEGGHSHRRVVHAADATGAAVEKTLVKKVKELPNVTLLERHAAIDLITTKETSSNSSKCVGAYLYDSINSAIVTIAAKTVVLGTGGIGKVYLYTSNPDVATGDGIAMAWRAGCSIANMEFVQFHPTCLYHPQAKTILLTEALRGEGGKLILPDGERFMKKFDSRGELASRDVVARAIDHEMKRLGLECVYLDISHKPKEFILEHFPNAYETCKKYGIDITTNPIPVVPAAHYLCGGVLTDINGKAELDGLYAVGETACTGLHGANRMASNSLLECIVVASSAVKSITADMANDFLSVNPPEWDESRVVQGNEDVIISHSWDELRRLMWNYVGIVRSDKRLGRAKQRIELLQREINEFYSHFKISTDLIELRNLALVAELIVVSALSRKESRGLHYTLDHPDKDENGFKRNTVININT
ncbi:L-aspartate oxidase [Gammaproteobacteria bacterium]|nr:L-aspartate oxidase [Gammaproteobacteria bacterium]